MGSVYQSGANVVRSRVDLDNVDFCSHRSDTHGALVTAVERNRVLVLGLG